MDQTLLIVGASARAAAFSACRAGFSVRTLDLFADQDLQTIGRADRISSYPCSLQRQARTLPASPWLYTGGLENYPAVIDRLASERPLLGNAGDVVRGVRDPVQLADALRGTEFEFPETRPITAVPPDDGSWLVKPFRSSGGSGIHVWRGQRLERPSQQYFQQQLAGEPISAVYCATGDDVVLLGASRQLVGCDWCRAKPFAYCGSVGPLVLPVDLAAQLTALGERLVTNFSLTGLFGVDCLLADSRVIVVEVNPRYPASAEVLERISWQSVIALHVQACQGTLPRDETPTDQKQSATGIAGKCIVYAERDLTVDERLAAWLACPNDTDQRDLHTDPWSPRLADIPEEGSSIRNGWPIATLLEQADSEQQVIERLRYRAEELYRFTAAL